MADLPDLYTWNEKFEKDALAYLEDAKTRPTDEKLDMVIAMMQVMLRRVRQPAEADPSHPEHYL